MKSALKGTIGGECYRGVCTAKNPTWWNWSTEKYYCRACAKLILSFPENAGIFDEHFQIENSLLPEGYVLIEEPAKEYSSYTSGRLRVYLEGTLDNVAAMEYVCNTREADFWINDLVTKPEHRRKKLATTILSEFIKKNPEKTIKLLARPRDYHTGMSLETLRAFYETFGFVKEYFHEDGYRMVKESEVKIT